MAIAPTGAVADTAPEASSPPGVLPELASPWTTAARPFLLGGIAGTALFILLEDPVVDPTQAEVADDRPIGSFSKIGDYGGQLIPNGLYAVGMLIHGWSARNDRSFERAGLMLKASLYAVSVSSLIKVTVHEPRPGDPSDKKSFPSGHSTAAFAFASFVAAEHPLPYGIAAFALASLTAASRINDNRHYLHDVVAGSTIGTAYGLGFSYVHRDYHREYDRKRVLQSFQVVPIYTHEARGAALIAEF